MDSLLAPLSADGFNIRDKTLVLSGDADPSTGGGEDAPLGSMYLQTTMDTYKKTGLADTDWTKFSLESSGSSSGVIIQVVSDFIDDRYGTTTIPLDNSTPKITEGTQIWSDTITPNSASNEIHIAFSLALVMSSDSKDIIVSIFKDSTCIAAEPVFMHHRREFYPYAVNTKNSPNTTSSVTYSARVGKRSGDSGTWYVNRAYNTTGKLGGKIDHQTYSLQEVVI